jgi:hypothetical protein
MVGHLLPEKLYQFNYNPVLQAYREGEGHFQNIQHMLQLCAEHTLDRLKERYNLTISAQDWERLNWMVFREFAPRERGENVKRLFVKSDDTTIYEVDFQPWRGRKRRFWVMFSEKLFCVMTAIPPEDIRIRVAHKGEFKDIDHTWSRLLKRRYDLLSTFMATNYRNPFESRPTEDRVIS